MAVVSNPYKVAYRSCGCFPDDMQNVVIDKCTLLRNSMSISL